MSKSYSEWSTEDLIKEIKQLKKRKKFGLVWEDKPEDVAEMCKTQLPILKEVRENAIEGNAKDVTNILIEGDNYHSLSVLSYTHPKAVDVIFIDPPYNTGNHTWKYNNKFVDDEDTYRHSKWLSFMAKRLRLAKKLLKNDGILIATIDDYEIHTLGLLLDQIFGENNRLANVSVMNKKSGRTTDKFFATCHEYYLFYAKDAEKAKINLMSTSADDLNQYKLSDETGPYKWRDFLRTGGYSTPEERPNSYYPIYFDQKNNEIITQKKANYIEVLPIDSKGNKRVWRQTIPSLEKLVARGDIKVELVRGNYKVRIKDRPKDGVKPKTVWDSPKYDAATHGTKLLESILGEARSFDFPKSLYAVHDALKITLEHKKEATVLDFFAGSGTTGHATLLLNKEDGGSRKFILCTNNEDNNDSGKGIAESICYPRIKKVMKGYQHNKKSVEGLGGSLKYFKTDFVDQVVTDNDKREFVSHSTDMLCLAEDTFIPVAFKKNQYAIFSGNGRTTGIVYDEDYLSDFKKEISKNDAPLVVYVFSYDNNYDEDDFSELHKLVKVKPVPASILNVYARIVRESAKKINL